jgi:tight adherence protein B
MPTAQITAAPSTDFTGILKEDNRFGTGRGVDTSDRVNSWFDTVMRQCGWDVAPSVVLMLCLCSALALGGLVFLLQENLLTTAFAGMIGYMLPIGAAMIARSRRQSVLMQQLPAMLEELGRAAKTGRSIEQCLQIVSEDTLSPLGDELRLATRRLQMGVSLKDALRDLPVRTGVMTLSLLSTTLTVQQQTGGDLVTVLNRLSRTIRDRLLFLGRLRASTAASRATATLMIVLPPAVLVFFMLRDPDYFQNLMASSWGRNATLAALALEVIGAVWVLRILKDSART